MLENEADTDVLAVFPVDHHIADQNRFFEALDQGAVLAEAGYLVTFGITPNCPDTCYGYIKAGEPLHEHDFGFSVSEFLEKPNADQTKSFLAEGNCYWNSGIFMFRRDVLLQAYFQHLPELYENLIPFLEGAKPLPSLTEIYEKLPSISIDHGIFEKADNVVVLPVDMGWNDVGSWGTLFDFFPQDENGNVLLGRVQEQDCQDSLFMSQKRLLATIGLKDTIVVDTADATLVCHRDRVHDVKDLVAAMNQKNVTETVIHPTVERPWGSYTVTDSGPCFQVKQIVVNPGKRLSLQLHHHRAEHWVVVAGTALVTLGSEIKEVASNESIYIPVETAHRLENPGSEPIRLIEVQTGSYLGEDDIVRLDDDFWRKSQQQYSKD